MVSMVLRKKSDVEIYHTTVDPRVFPLFVEVAVSNRHLSSL